MGAAFNMHFKIYFLSTVDSKLAPEIRLPAKRVVGFKNLKARHYGGSESIDFPSACGVAQHNEGHRRQTDISRGPHCKKLQAGES